MNQVMPCPSPFARLALALLMLTCPAGPLLAAQETNPVFEHFEGRWRYSYTILPDTTGGGTETHRTLPGGRWQVAEFEGQMFERPYSAHGVLGFDPDSGAYRNAFYDNYKLEPVIARGEFDPQTRLFVKLAEGVDYQGRACVWRQEMDLSDPLRYGLSMVAVYPDGEEVLTVEGHAERLVDAARERPFWMGCFDAVPWFARGEVPNAETRLMELVSSQGLRRFSEEWIAAAMEAAGPLEGWLDEGQRSQRPVFWYVPALEGQHVILPHLLDRYVEVGLLSDPDFAELLRRRFVAVKCAAGGELARRYGLLPPDFLEPGYLVLDADGEVLAQVDRLFMFQAEPHRRMLEGLLAELGNDAAHSAQFVAADAEWRAEPGLGQGLALAREALLDGAPARAHAVLAELKAHSAQDPGIALLEARLARVAHDAPAGRSALARIERATASPRTLLALEAEAGRLALGAGEFDTAAGHFERVFEVGGEDAAECGYQLGAVHYLSAREDAALGVWRALVEAHPASPWAPRAAAHLTIAGDGLRGEGPLTRAMQRLTWSAPVTREHGTRAPRGLDAEEAVVARAREVLLAQQRPNGAGYGAHWGGAGAAPPDEAVGEGPGVFGNIHTAISALAATALVAWRDVAPERVDAALARAQGYLLRDDLVVRGEAMGWVYADAFRIAYLLARHPERDTWDDELLDHEAAWIDAIVEWQAQNGGPIRHFSYGSTFVTALVTLVLADAREHGADVPGQVFEQTAAVLEGAREGDTGLFGYLVDAPALNRTPAGAACRQPLCTLALLRCGATDAGDVVRGLRTWFEHYAKFIEPPRYTNFHMSELDGSAGYFFFHNLFATAWAIERCGAQAAGEDFAGRLRELVLELPEVDGTFVDSGVSYGKSYGTAMALLALARLRG